MKVWKLVSGIMSIIMFVVVMFQSCAVGLANTLSENGESSGSIGVFVSIMLLTGGIVSIAVRNSTGKGGNIAIIILYGLGALLGLTSAGSYTDLMVWGSWCLICALLGFVGLIKKPKTNSEEK